MLASMSYTMEDSAYAVEILNKGGTLIGFIEAYLDNKLTVSKDQFLDVCRELQLQEARK